MLLYHGTQGSGKVSGRAAGASFGPYTPLKLTTVESASRNLDIIPRQTCSPYTLGIIAYHEKLASSEVSRTLVLSGSNAALQSTFLFRSSF